MKAAIYLIFLIYENDLTDLDKDKLRKIFEFE